MNKQQELNNIVNVHLGKAGDGSVVNPYVTPDHIDKTLLVPVPRYLNREDYGIEENKLPFKGYDVWNCYEVSALTNNGYPVTGIVKLVYSCDSPSIVESKSLKLYLNSYNMVALGTTIEEVTDNIVKTITADLSESLETEVKVSFFTPYGQRPSDIVRPDYVKYLETQVDLTSIVFNNYNEDPNILKLVTTDKKYTTFLTNALRSNCRVTNQPDWGTVMVCIKGDIVISEESFLQYIVSMRKENHFHEEIVECIYKRLFDLLPTDTQFYVGALYTRRGGIDINPFRTSNMEILLHDHARYLDTSFASIKTLHQ